MSQQYEDEAEVIVPELMQPESGTVATRTQWTQEEVNALVATAHRYPRDMKRFHDNMLQTIQELDEKEARGINYNAPVGRKKVLDADGNPKLDKRGKEIWEDEYAQGPSVRLAELVYSNYGNIMFKQDSWCDEKFAYGVCHGWDYEANNAFTRKAVYSITYSAKGGRAGTRYADYLVAKMMMKAQAVAFRDVVFKLVPKVIYNKYAQTAMDKAVGPDAEREKRVKRYLDMFSKIGGVERQRIVEKLGFSAEEEIDLDGLRKLIGWYSAIEQGETSMTELFQEPSEAVATAKKGSDGLEDVLEQREAAKGNGKPADKSERSKVSGQHGKSRTPAGGKESLPNEEKGKGAGKREFDPESCPPDCKNIETKADGAVGVRVPCEEFDGCPR